MHESFNPLASAQSASGAVACMRRELRERHVSRPPVGDRMVDAIRVIESPLLHDGTAP